MRQERAELGGERIREEGGKPASLAAAALRRLGKRKSNLQSLIFAVEFQQVEDTPKTCRFDIERVWDAIG